MTGNTLNGFEGIEFRADTVMPKTYRWGKKVLGRTNVVISIAPKVPSRVQGNFTYQWTYSVPKRWPAKDSVEMINRAKDEILGKVAATRSAENAWMGSPEAKKVQEIEEKERKDREERDATRKIMEGRNARIMKIVHGAGISPDEHGSWNRGGDYHSIVVLDAVLDPLNMVQYLAFGEGIALVADDRQRTYAKSSKWRASTRRDVYLVGQNESGTYFAHAVPSDMRSVAAAFRWIWDGNQIESRNGDVGIAIPKVTIKKNGEQKKVHIVDSHYVEGEILQNGALYARNATVYHEKGQHDPVKIGNEWRKIVVARRSTKASSTKD